MIDTKFDIQNGTRVQMAIAEDPANAEFTLTTTFVKAIDSAFFLVSVPLVGGSPVTVGENQRILIKYINQDIPMIMTAYCDDVVKEGIRNCWKLRRVTERRVIIQRADERYKIALKVYYRQDTWTPNMDGIIEKDEAMTLDISAGGVALYIDQRFDVGEVCKLTLPRVGTEKAGEQIEDIVSTVCWEREAPKGSPFRNICGIQFRYADMSEKQIVKNYIDHVKVLYKL